MSNDDDVVSEDKVDKSLRITLAKQAELTTTGESNILDDSQLYHDTKPKRNAPAPAHFGLDRPGNKVFEAVRKTAEHVLTAQIIHQRIILFDEDRNEDQFGSFVRIATRRINSVAKSCAKRIVIEAWGKTTKREIGKFELSVSTSDLQGEASKFRFVTNIVTESEKHLPQPQATPLSVKDVVKTRIRNAATYDEVCSIVLREIIKPNI